MWQETYTGIYPAQKLLEFDEAQHAEKFRRLITDPANQVVLLREEGQDAGYFVLGKPRPGCLKLKRSPMQARYGHLIEEMYKGAKKSRI